MSESYLPLPSVARFLGATYIFVVRSLISLLFPSAMPSWSSCDGPEPPLNMSLSHCRKKNFSFLNDGSACCFQWTRLLTIDMCFLVPHIQDRDALADWSSVRCWATFYSQWGEQSITRRMLRCPVVPLCVFIDLPPDVDDSGKYREVFGRDADSWGSRESWELQRSHLHLERWHGRCLLFFFFALKMGGGQFHLAKSYREDLYPSDNNSPTEKRLLFAAWAVCGCSSLLPLPLAGSIHFRM